MKLKAKKKDGKLFIKKEELVRWEIDHNNEAEIELIIEEEMPLTGKHLHIKDTLEPIKEEIYRVLFGKDTPEEDGPIVKLMKSVGYDDTPEEPNERQIWQGIEKDTPEIEELGYEDMFTARIQRYNDKHTRKINEIIRKINKLTDT